jgi:hypothetical protein
MADVAMTTALAGGAATAGSGVAGAYSSYQAGRANRSLDRYNATLARTQETQALQAGEFKAGQVDLQARQLQGATRAAQGASGTVIGAGTNASVLNSEQAMSEMDKLMIRTNARRQAFGFAVTAANDDNQGNLAYRAGVQGAVGTLLNTGAQEALNYQRYQAGKKGLGSQEDSF